MNPELFLRVRAVFEEALSLAAEERNAFVASRLGDKPELLAEVEKMLAADERAGDFLRPPGEGTLAGAIHEQGAAMALEAGDRIGEFLLKERIGSGGMGEVWSAEQARPRRLIALKVLRATLLSGRSRRRFEDEAELLARLSHPGIARVLAAGVIEGDQATPSRPWFAMELVEGARSLTEFARELPLTRRLELFRDACDAVHHGHLRQVIHRDLKPENLLVDTAGRLRVIDFGIGRAGGQDESRRAETMSGELVGTLSYMSPEQIEGKREAVDARTDVYALGVVLFELLVGASPWKADSTSWAALTREVTSTDAPAPSGLVQGLSGELDWIVARAMEKNPERRYASAHELACEIVRFQRDEPLLAGPPSAGYRAAKFARRNRALVVGTAVAAVLLLLGILGTSWGWMRSVDREQQLEVAKLQAQEARDFALDAEQLSAQREARAVALNGFLDNMLRTANPLRAVLGVSGETSVGDMLQRATEGIDSAFPGSPELEADTRLLMGVSLHGQGRYADAAEQLGRAWTLYEAMLPERLLEAIRSQRLLATSLAHLGEWDAAMVAMKAAHARGFANLEDDNPNLGGLEGDLAWLLQEVGQLAESVPHARSAVERLDAAGAEFEPMAATVATVLARSLRGLGDDAATEAAYLDAIARIGRAFGEESVYAGIAASNLGALLFRHGRTEEALVHFERAVVLEREGLGSDNPMLATTLYNLGAALQEVGRLEEAEEVAEECLVLLEATLGEHHEETADAVFALASIRMDMELFAAAQNDFEHYLKLLQELGKGEASMGTMIEFRILEMRCRSGQEPDASAAKESFLAKQAAQLEALGAEHSLCDFADRTAARIFPDDRD